jgi:hypothetical protein
MPPEDRESRAQRFAMPQLRSATSTASLAPLTCRSHTACSLPLDATQRLVGGHLRFYRHGTYQTPGDPANYRARVYGSVVGNAFVQSSTKQRVIVDF